eukprot:TRINITY_DN7171_c0_g1_i10.p1 TRINITY_DN7171_c0_g1~~TRINITY_DN7171_c0_g1_i10.p1  ORF type:complete len:245 (-),score=69.11 TRINITY_DN7171_c0_g1_i10:35-769(-)
MNKPYICGTTGDAERLHWLDLFKRDSNVNCLFISKVGDNSIDLPDVNVIVQISSHYASRRQEAQRLGRILRPKARSGSEFNAFFYTLVSNDTKEMFYATKRQRFLVDQGYSFHVVTSLVPDKPEGIEGPPLAFSTRQEQIDLLCRVMAVEEKEGQIEVVDDDERDLMAARNKRIQANRKRGSISALTGDDSKVYAEYEKEKKTQPNPKKQKTTHQSALMIARSNQQKKERKQIKSYLASMNMNS